MSDETINTIFGLDHPIHALGLPDPDGSPFPDPAISVLYRRFCASLKFCDESGTSITCDTDFLNLDMKHAPEYLPQVRLIAALFRPTESDLETIRERSGIEEAFTHGLGYSRKERVSLLAPRVFFREFRRFTQTDEYQAFVEGKPYPSVLVRIDTTISSSPGASWYTSQVIRRHSVDWAMIFEYGDCENEAGEAFPLIMGFAKISSLRRSAGTVYLSRGPRMGGLPDNYGMNLPAGGGEEEPILSTQDKEVLSLCFSTSDGVGPRREYEAGYGKLLLGFPDHVLDRVSRKLGLRKMTNKSVWKTSTPLRDFCGHVIRLCSASQFTPEELFKGYANVFPSTLEALVEADRLKEEGRKREEERRKQEEERKKGEAKTERGLKAVAWKAHLAALPPKGPGDFPSGFELGRLEVEDIAGLNHWLHEVRRSRNVSVVMRLVSPARTYCSGYAWLSYLSGLEESEKARKINHHSIFGLEEVAPGNPEEIIRRMEFSKETPVREAFDTYFAHREDEPEKGPEVIA